MDGVLHISSSSINNVPHSKYGWLSPSSVSYEKSDSCYGSGVVSYNSQGFRAPPVGRASDANYKVCILGDSTMQGYQLPDGTHLPHLLAQELEAQGYDPYVLPLAVGGYGSLQEWMLFEDFCKAIEPDLIVWHWSGNDITNNSYLADSHSGSNNARPRPYFENGKIEMKRAYPLSISEKIDWMLTTRLVNGLLLEYWQKDQYFQDKYKEIGWSVAEVMIERVASSEIPIVALVQDSAERAKSIFQKAGIQLAQYSDFDESHQCLPRDGHPNKLGHQHMLTALSPFFGS
jgi:hypothetical protein